MSKDRARWRSRPGKAEFEAALRYLTLQFPNKDAQHIVSLARKARVGEHVAKDLLRASQLPLLSIEEKHVAADLKKIRKGKTIAPIILVQGDMKRAVPLVVADGYHRLCAACHANEDAPVAAVMVPLS